MSQHRIATPRELHTLFIKLYRTVKRRLAALELTHNILQAGKRLLKSQSITGFL